MIHESVLKGYVLEELLARLVKSSGYSLIVDKDHDPWALDGAGNGLRVHGRGADHQVDVLGELDVDVQLALPIRLFLEGKCRGQKSDLRDVRNAVGTIDDVNQYYTSKDASTSPPPRRYQYKYALASTGGFTKDAIYYAVTHQLSLVDLSDSSAAWLRRLVDRITARLLTLASASDLASFPVGQMREALRRALGTHPDADIDLEDEDSAVAPVDRALATHGPLDGLDTRALAEVCGEAAADLSGRLFLAWTSSPFIVFMQPTERMRRADDLAAAVDTEGRRLRGRLTFVGPTPDEGRWTLAAETPGRLEPTQAATPHLDPRGSVVVEMSLWVPPDLEPFLIATAPRDSRDQLNEASSVFTVQISPDIRTQITYDPIPLPEVDPDRSGQDGEAVWRSIRDRYWQPQRRVETDDDLDPDIWPPWSEAAYRELIGRLQAEGAVQAAIIQAAATDGGLVTRASVYRLANRHRDRTLRGITKPSTRIARDLIDEGILDPGATTPLWAVYRSGVQASHFEVPAEFTEYVDPLWYEPQ